LPTIGCNKSNDKILISSHKNDENDDNKTISSHENDENDDDSEGPSHHQDESGNGIDNTSINLSISDETPEKGDCESENSAKDSEITEEIIDVDEAFYEGIYSIMNRCRKENLGDPLAIAEAKREDPKFNRIFKDYRAVERLLLQATDDRDETIPLNSKERKNIDMMMTQLSDNFEVVKSILQTRTSSKKNKLPKTKSFSPSISTNGIKKSANLTVNTNVIGHKLEELTVLNFKSLKKWLTKYKIMKQQSPGTNRLHFMSDRVKDLITSSLKRKEQISKNNRKAWENFSDENFSNFC
jgi:hypothetical protein